MVCGRNGLLQRVITDCAPVRFSWTEDREKLVEKAEIRSVFDLVRLFEAAKRPVNEESNSVFVLEGRACFVLVGNRDAQLAAQFARVRKAPHFVPKEAPKNVVGVAWLGGAHEERTIRFAAVHLKRLADGQVEEEDDEEEEEEDVEDEEQEELEEAEELMQNDLEKTRLIAEVVKEENAKLAKQFADENAVALRQLSEQLERKEKELGRQDLEREKLSKEYSERFEMLRFASAREVAELEKRVADLKEANSMLEKKHEKNLNDAIALLEANHARQTAESEKRATDLKELNAMLERKHETSMKEAVALLEANHARHAADWEAAHVRELQSERARASKLQMELEELKSVNLRLEKDRVELEKLRSRELADFRARVSELKDASALLEREREHLKSATARDTAMLENTITENQLLKARVDELKRLLDLCSDANLQMEILLTSKN